MTFAMYVIVEGHGEVQALPVLLRRLAQECLRRYDLHVFPPHRVPKGRIIAGDHLERAAELGRRRLREFGGVGAILLLLDADDDCPAELGPRLSARLKAAVPEVALSVVLAKREFEAWFLASSRSLRRHPNVSNDADPPPFPEEIRSAKKYLAREILLPGLIYSETVDQVSLTAMMDLREALGCPSFAKLCRDFRALAATEN